MPGPLTAPPFRLRALGEIALRTRRREEMERFYGETLGLPLLARRERGITFFKLGESFGGHTAVLALFDAEDEPSSTGALHHLALALDWEDQAAAIRWLEAAGLPVTVERFDWVGWRGVFTRDPDGNTVELVAAEPVGG